MTPHCYRCRSAVSPRGECGCRDGIALLVGDCLAVIPGLAEKSVDLVFGSPPYEDCRTYGIDFALKGQAWVDWMVAVFEASLRVCRGLVAFVVEGRTRNFRYSSTPDLLKADLHRKGICLRKSPIFHRIGIAGSGGPDFYRNDYEPIVCATNGGKLPWSDNTAMGHPPKWAPGGEMSHRLTDGTRRNQWGGTHGGGQRTATGTHECSDARPGHKVQTRRKANGERLRDGLYEPPTLANPGNVIHCKVGGGLMGHPLAHENEAPFPESLVEWFVRSFCPEGGVVLDPFSGSGTTAAVAKKWNRKAIGIDVRESQCGVAAERLRQEILF